MLEALKYKVNDRKFSDISPLFSQDYKKEVFCYPQEAVVYSGAEHILVPKLSNITVLPNLLTQTGFLILGSTFGHQHTQKEKGDNRIFQEIYEFLGYGAMLLRNANGTFLYVLKPQEKVLVGTGDNMTIINLSTTPLVTLDYANPKMNSAHKALEKRLGSLAIARFSIDGTEKGVFSFNVNEDYISEGHVKCTASRTAELECSLGENLYEKLEESYPLFKQRGIELRFGGNIPDDLQDEFSKPLNHLVLTQNKTLLECLEIKKTVKVTTADQNSLNSEHCQKQEVFLKS